MALRAMTCGLLLLAAVLGTCTARDLGAVKQAATAFEAWLNRTGATLAPAVRVIPAPLGDEQPGARLRLRAIEDIAEGQELLRIPLPFVIWRGTAIGPSLPPAARRSIQLVLDGFAVAPGHGPPERGERLAPGARGEDMGLALFLMAHAALGDLSPWKPYISTLPKQLLVPVSFGQSALEALQDPAVAGQARHSAWTRKRAFRQLAFALQRISAAVRSRLRAARRGKPKQSPASFSSFNWALSAVEARSLSLRGQKFLVPGADHIGYEPHSFRAAAQGARFLRFHRLEAPTGEGAKPAGGTGQPEHFVVLADHPIALGSVITEDYGDTPSYVLFQHHGFIPAINPFDCARVDVPQGLRRSAIEGIRSDAESLTAEFTLPPVSLETAALMQKLQLALPATVCIRPGALPHHLTAALALAGADDEDRKLCEELESSPELGRMQCVERILNSTRMVPGSATTMLQWVNKATAAIADATREAFATTIEVDTAILAAADACSGHNASRLCVPMLPDDHAAVRFRLSRKLMLQSVSKYFDKLAKVSRGTARGTNSASTTASHGLSIDELDKKFRERCKQCSSKVFVRAMVAGDGVTEQAILFPESDLPAGACISDSNVHAGQGIIRQTISYSGTTGVAHWTPPTIGGGMELLQSQWLTMSLHSGRLVADQLRTREALTAALIKSEVHPGSCGLLGFSRSTASRACRPEASGLPSWLDAITKALHTVQIGGYRGSLAWQFLTMSLSTLASLSQDRSPRGDAMIWPSPRRRVSRDPDASLLADGLAGFQLAFQPASAGTDAVVLTQELELLLSSSVVAKLSGNRISARTAGSDINSFIGVGEGLAPPPSLGVLDFLDPALSRLQVGLCRSSPWYGWQLSRLWQFGFSRQSVVVPVSGAQSLAPRFDKFIAAATGLLSSDLRMVCATQLVRQVLQARAKLPRSMTPVEGRLNGTGIHISREADMRAFDAVNLLFAKDEARFESTLTAGPAGLDDGPHVCVLHEPAGGGPHTSAGGCGICVACGQPAAAQGEDDWLVL